MIFSLSSPEADASNSISLSSRVISFFSFFLFCCFIFNSLFMFGFKIKINDLKRNKLRNRKEKKGQKFSSLLFICLFVWFC
jgi:hypothetical protein